MSDLLSYLYDIACDKIFPNQPKDTTITGETIKIQKAHPWLFILFAVIGGVILLWTQGKKTTIACLISLFIGILLGHFFF